MARYFVRLSLPGGTTTTGALTGTGTYADPYNRLPFADTGGNWEMVSGDTCEVQVGQAACGYTITIDVSNITIRGFADGTAEYPDGDPLTLTLPGNIPLTTRTLAVGRGMWAINTLLITGTPANVVPMRLVGSASNVTIEDVWFPASVDNPNKNLITAGPTPTTNRGLTIRRSRFENGVHKGIGGGMLDWYIEFCYFGKLQQDGLLMSAPNPWTFNAATGVWTSETPHTRAGSRDVIRYCHFDDVPNDPDPGRPGDPIQMGVAAGEAGANLTVHGCYIFKPSLGKQAILLGGLGDITISHNFFDGGEVPQIGNPAVFPSQTPNQQTSCGIFFNSVRGNVVLRGNVWRNSLGQGIRLNSSGAAHGAGTTAAGVPYDASEGYWSIGPGATILIENNLMVSTAAAVAARGSGNAYFFRFGNEGPHGAGSIIVRKNTCIGTFNLAVYRGLTGGVFNDGFSFLSEDNLFLVSMIPGTYQVDMAGVNIRNSKFTFRNDRWLTGSQFRTSSIVYTSLANWVAAMTAGGATMSGNSEITLSAAMVDLLGQPENLSPILAAAVGYSKPMLGANKIPRFKPNAVGAMEASLAVAAPPPPPPAPSLRLTAPSPATATVGVQSGDFTVTASDLTGTVTVTPASSAAATFNPTSLTFAINDAPKTFKMTATAAATHSVSITNNAGIANPVAVSVVASSSSLPIPNPTSQRAYLDTIVGVDGNPAFGVDNGSPAQSYWVNNSTGNDANAGTEAAPLKTLARANTLLGANRHAIVRLAAGQTYAITAMLDLRGGLSATQRCTYTRYGAGANPVIRPSAGTANDTIRIQQSYTTWDGIDVNGVDITSGSNATEGIAIRAFATAPVDVVVKNCEVRNMRGRGFYCERKANGANTVEPWLFDTCTATGNGNHGFWTQTGYCFACTAVNNGLRVGAHGFSCYVRENTLAAGGWTNTTGTIWTRAMPATVWSLYTLTGGSGTWRRLRKAGNNVTSPLPGQYSTVDGQVYINVSGTGITPNSVQWFYAIRKGNPRWLFCNANNNRMYGPISGDTFAEEGDGFQHDDSTHGALCVGCMSYENDGHAFRFNIAEKCEVYGLIGYANHSSGMMVQSSIDCTIDGMTLFGNNVAGGERIDNVAITTPTNAEGDSALLLVTDVNGCVIRNTYIDSNERRSCVEANGTCNLTGFELNDVELKNLRAGSTTPTFKVSGAPHTLAGVRQNLTGLTLTAAGRPTSTLRGVGVNATKRDPDGYASANPPQIGAYVLAADRA